MRKSPILPGWWVSIFTILIMIQAGSLFAEEGTARLTFQKTVVTSNKATYTIKKGDTSNRIVQRLGAAAPRLSVLKSLNPQISNLNRIYPGQQLVIVYEEGKEIEGQAVPQTVKNYTVKKGDSLTRIILSELKPPPDGVVTVIRRVWTLKPEMASVNTIYPGQNLKLPEVVK